MRTAVRGLVAIVALWLAFGAATPVLAAATFASSCDLGCHGTAGISGPRLNAASPTANITVINQANTNHGMFTAGSAGYTNADLQAIAQEIDGAISRTQTATVNYNSSGNNITISTLFVDSSSPVITGTSVSTAATAPNSAAPSSGVIVAYTHAATNCTADSFQVIGTGPGGITTSTAPRTVNVSITPPTITAGGTTPTIAYNTSTQTITLTVLPSNLTLNTLSVGAASEGTATATGGLTFTYAASATPISNTVTVPFTINTPNCGTKSGTVTITITPQIISSGTATGTQGSAFSYQISSIPQATGYSMSAADITTLGNVGLSFSAVTGQITGIPTVSGPAFNVTINANTSSGTVSRTLAITILSGGTSTLTGPNTATGATITGANAVTGTAGTALNIAYTASNPTINSVGSSGLPSGLSFGITNAASGAVAITGTPAQSQSSGNSNVFNVTLNATNGSGAGPNKSLTLTINPSVVATLTNASLTPSQNVSFSYNFLTGNVTNIANSAQITFTATGLPAGLSINPGTGVISGTPTASGGPTVATVTATNAAGAANASVTFNITPTSVPSITSPTAVSGTIGTAITAVQIVATNPPITSYSGSGLPTGITVSPTGLISGTPTVNGTFNATLTANNAAGPGTLIVPFTISAVPASAGAGSMTVPLNTATMVDLAAFITGTGITGVQISSNPAHGQVTINGTRATYTPASNYFGSDSFSYVAFGASGTSAPAAIAVTIVGRPDPSQDATVVGTINNQIETARRFSQSQVSNFQRRMESLHRGGGAPGSGSANTAQQGGNTDPAEPAERTALADNSSTRLRQPSSNQNADPFANAQNMLGAVNPGVRLASLAPVTDAANPATGVMNPMTGAANPTTAALGAAGPGMLGSLASFASNRTLNLASIGTVGGTTEPAIGATSFWMGGDARFGTRDPVSGAMGGTSFRTDGVSAGVDRRFSDKLVLGLGFGYAHDKASIGTDGSQSRATGTSAAAYGSYQLTQKTYIDALLGYGTIGLDTDRFVSALNSYASSHRTGNQLFGSVTASYEFRKYDLLLSPYGRLDFTVNKLNQTSESGVGNFALTYFDQTDRTVRTTLGMRAESSHETDWGVVKPRLRVEYQHGFQGGGSAQLAYSDLIGGPNYLVNTNTTDRNTIVAGLGGSLVMRNGLKLGLDYQIMRSFAAETSQAVRFTLEKEFDGKGSSASLLPNFDSALPLWGINVDAGYMYDRNVSRGRDSGEKLSDQSYTLNLNKGWIFPVSEHTRAVVALSGGAEKFHDYEGLSRLYAGALGEFQYRTSGAFGAPTYALFARATGEQFESYLRDGYRYAVGLSVRKPVTDRISLFGAVTHNERSATSRVFTGSDNSARLNVDYAATATSTLYMTGEYRRGDAVSSGLPSLASLDIAKVFARDDAFNDQLFAYRFEATTWLTTLGYNLPFGPRDALDLSWRHIQSTSVDSSIVYGKSRYYTDQLSVSYLLRF